MGGIVYSESYRKIDNVLYSVSKYGALRWYYTDEKRWIDLKGLVGLPKLPNPFAGRVTPYIVLRLRSERRDGDCWGKLEWYDSVLSVPVDTEFVKVLAVTL
ncbi:hypothetical protein F2Q68_00005629 [Brassica cretica]|nr:hypothetical protein F2Q68_00005629 [Brassica cretica]